MASVSGIQLSSYIPAAQRAALEELVFFNSCQDRVLEGIVDAIEVFGAPEIIADRQGLRVRVAQRPEAQSLFAVDLLTGRPVGIAIYVRADVEYLTVLHVGIAHEFASGGTRASEQLLLRLIRELRRSSRRMKGVRGLQLYYLNGRARERTRTVRERILT